MQEVGSDESVSYVGRRPVTKARKYAYVSNVCVPEHVRRRGIAQRMMAAAARVVKEWGEFNLQVKPSEPH